MRVREIRCHCNLWLTQIFFYVIFDTFGTTGARIPSFLGKGLNVGKDPESVSPWSCVQPGPVVHIVARVFHRLRL